MHDFNKFDEFDSLEEETEAAAILPQFDYKDLDGFLPPSRSYTRDLQEYAMKQDEIIDSLQSEVLDLEHKLAKSGNQFYQKDAGKWGKAWTEINIAYGKLQGEKIAAEARLQAEIDRLQYLNQQLQTDLEIAEARLQGLVAVEVIDNKPKRALPERDSSGRFSAPVKSREEIATDYHSAGYKNTEIAQMMGVSPETVARYIKNYSHKQEKLYQNRIEESQQRDIDKELISEHNFEKYGFSCVF